MNEAEPDFVVTTTDTEIVVRRRTGKIERVLFADLKQIAIQTTDEGPLVPDVWWIMIGENDSGCVFPQGATGEDAVLERLMKLPGFNFAALTEAMKSTRQERFSIWQRAAS